MALWLWETRHLWENCGIFRVWEKEQTSAKSYLHRNPYIRKGSIAACMAYNLNFGGNVLTGSPAIADRLRRCPQP